MKRYYIESKCKSENWLTKGCKDIKGEVKLTLSYLNNKRDMLINNVIRFTNNGYIKYVNDNDEDTSQKFMKEMYKDCLEIIKLESEINEREKGDVNNDI